LRASHSACATPLQRCGRFPPDLLAWWAHALAGWMTIELR
jgi:hypothetical protein